MSSSNHRIQAAVDWFKQTYLHEHENGTLLMFRLRLKFPDLNFAEYGRVGKACRRFLRLHLTQAELRCECAPMDTRSSVKAWQKPAYLDEATRLVALVRGRFPREDLPEHREEIRQKFLNEKPILNFPFLPPPAAEADSDSEGVIESAEPHSRPKCATQPLNVDLGPTMQAGQRNMAVPRRAKVDRFCFKAMLADKALQSCRNAHQPDTRAPRSAKAVFQGELKTSPISIKHDTSEPLSLADDMDRAIDRLDAVHTRVIGHLIKLEDVRLLGFEREGVKELRAAVQAEVNLNAKRGRRSNSLPSYSLESYMAAYGLHPQYKTMSSKPKSVHQLLADI